MGQVGIPKLVKVFFCKDTGDGICTENFWCDCGKDTDNDLGRFKYEDRPDSNFNKIINCRACGKLIKMSSQSWRRIFIRCDTGEELGIKENLPAGACYEGGWRNGPDSRALTVVLPGGHHWHIDSRSSNCTKKDDNVHFCWCRHGKPEDGTLHVDKNGNTCAAGGGSIIVPEYHGFLHRINESEAKVYGVGPGSYLVEC